MSGCSAVDDDLAIEQQPATNGKSSCSNSKGCSSQGCQQQQGSFGSWVRRQATKSNTAQAAQDLQQLQLQQAESGTLGACMKCKTRQAVLPIRQQEPYCNECLETGILQKFRTCTKAQGLIKTGDNVLLALSGGAASLSLLHCTLAMQSSNMSRPERGKVPFKLSVLHVDSSTARGVPSDQAQAKQQQMRAAVAAAGFMEQLLVLPLHAVFASQEQLQQLLQAQQQQGEAHQLQQQQLESIHTAAATTGVSVIGTAQQSTDLPVLPEQQICNNRSSTHTSHAQELDQQWQQQLSELLSNIADTTGREDLAVCLQDRLLLHAAAALSCTRLLCGDCADRVAATIIAEAAKGRGFSLPGDIQMLDARMLVHGGPAVLRPLREVTYKELVGLCAYKGLSWNDRPMGQPLSWKQSTTTAGGSSRSKTDSHHAVSLNSLSERFIADMAGSVPASIYTILRTASHLKPFGFSEASAVPGAAEMQSSAIRQAVQNRQQAVHGSCDNMEGQKQWQLCSVCRAPLLETGDDNGVVDAAAATDRLMLAGLTGAHSNQLCYSCNRQIVYKTQLDAAAVETSLEARMERLRALLPPGLLLEDG